MTDDDALVADERPPASAADSLRLIDAQRAEALRSLNPDPRLLYWPWGVAWLVGFGLFYLAHGPDDRTLVAMPDWLPLTTLFGLMAVALTVTWTAGIKAGRHVSGDSATKGMMYGLSWFVGFASVGVALGRVGDLLPDAEAGLLWAATSVGLVSALYLAGAAIWSAREMFVLGCWMGLINIVGVVAGPGWHSLLISVAGGGGLIVAGAFSMRRTGRRS